MADDSANMNGSPMTAAKRIFQRGDEVIHQRRPEWGEGLIEQVANVTYAGHPAQRLVVRFAHHGRVTLNSAVAPLASKEAEKTMSMISRKHNAASSTDVSPGWLDRLDQSRAEDVFTRLPDEMVDPFASEARRLTATLESFRFGEDPTQNPRGLIDWAVAQTGLEDPLTQYTRHELEEAFKRFVVKRDEHLQQLVGQLKRIDGQKIIQQLMSSTRYPGARAALKRAMKR